MVCLDANILIEIILGREHSAECKRFIEKSSGDLAITMLSLDLAMYYGESKNLNLQEVTRFLRLFAWLPLTEADAESAFKRYDGRDFEDALQIACAKREGCLEFVTLDKPLAKKYAKDIPVRLLGSGAAV